MQDEMSLAELERIAAAGTDRDYARERREDEETMRMVDELERDDQERAADSVEEALLGWRDELTGLPPEGMESPRYRNERELAYTNWIHSEAGARTRRNMHPRAEEYLRRQERADYGSRSRSFEEVR